MTDNNDHKTELPAGWAWTSIGEITQPIEKVNPKEKPDEEFVYLDISSIDNKAFRIFEPKQYIGANAPSRARQLVKAHDVLFSTVRTYLMNIAPVPEIYDGQIGSTGFSVLRAEDGISHQYLFYYCLTPKFLTPLEKLQRGTSYPAVRDSDVRAQSFPLPPLAEQHRIVAKIEELFSDLDHSVAALETVQAQLKTYRQAVLKYAFEGKLTEQWRQQHAPPPAAELLARIQIEREARYRQQLDEWRAAVREWEVQGKKGKKPSKPQKPRELPPLTEAELPSLPYGWAWIPVEQLASLDPRSIQSGPFGSNLLHSEFQSTGILAIGIDNVLDGKFSMGKQHRISFEKFDELRKFAARPLDVLITVMATVGRCCVVPSNLETAIITKHVYRISTNQFFINPYYLMYSLIGCDVVQKQLSGSVRGQTRPGINGTILKQIAVPIPSLNEQNVIVEEIEARLSVVDKVEEIIETALQQAEALRQSILKQAFAGQLVPQDPNDEPAEMLLARIQMQRVQ